MGGVASRYASWTALWNELCWGRPPLPFRSSQTFPASGFLCILSPFQFHPCRDKPFCWSKCRDIYHPFFVIQNRENRDVLVYGLHIGVLYAVTLRNSFQRHSDIRKKTISPWNARFNAWTWPVAITSGSLNTLYFPTTMSADSMIFGQHGLIHKHRGSVRSINLNRIGGRTQSPWQAILLFQRAIETTL